jgi:FkbM family methyltransferase
MGNGADRMLWPLVRGFANVRRWVKQATGIRIKGLGFLLRRLRSDFAFEACGFRWHLDHRIGGSYAVLLTGAFQEPETHLFLTRIANDADFDISFVDVGANIGEMVIPMAAHPRTRRVIAFEPHPVCAHVIRRNLTLNGLHKTEIREELVGDGSAQPYVIDASESSISGIRHGAANAQIMRAVRLDDVLSITEEVILLIDVEGAELDVLRGAQRLIATRRPLIIFEYNSVTSQHFSLDDVRAVLGIGYELLRLRTDGSLDSVLQDMWNCVAVSRDSRFYALVQSANADFEG